MMDIETKDLIERIRCCASDGSNTECELCQWQHDCLMMVDARELWLHIADALEEMAEKIDRYESIIEAMPIEC